MNNEEYNALLDSLWKTYKLLKSMDERALTPKQRRQHYEGMSKTYNAIIEVENRAFAKLTEQALEIMGPLSRETTALQEKLTSLKTTTQKLKAVSDALGTLVSIAAILA